MRPDKSQRKKYLSEALLAPGSDPIDFLAAHLEDKFPGSAVMLYGSGNSVLSDENPTNILFDFYVIVPDYRSAYKSKILGILNYILPPNVFYLETTTSVGKLRAKYAVLSIDHFEKLLSARTFHSYFWARFAQPSKIVTAPNELRQRIIQAIENAIDTFTRRSAPLVEGQSNVNDLWTAGLSRSYKAELRAEAPGRVAQLLLNYGEWPQRVTTAVDLSAHSTSQKLMCRLEWRLRSVQGGVLSILRLLKGTLTFEGGVDYIIWKISRHAGFTVPVKEWERRFPLLSAPFLAARYYRMKKSR